MGNRLIQSWIQNPAKHLRWSFFRKSLLSPEANTEPCKTSKMEHRGLCKNSHNEKSFTIFVKTSILDVWQCSEYASELASKVTDVSFWKQFEYQR